MRFIEAQGALRKQTFKVRGGNLKSRIELLHDFRTDRLFLEIFLTILLTVIEEMLHSAIARDR